MQNNTGKILERTTIKKELLFIVLSLATIFTVPKTHTVVGYCAALRWP